MDDESDGRIDASELFDTIRELWASQRQQIFERITALKTFAGHGLELEPDSRLEAIRLSHMLAGSLGSYGFSEGTRVSREIEARFQRNDPGGGDLPGMVETLERILEGEPQFEGEDHASSIHGRTTVLIVDDDESVRELISLQARMQGFLPNVASTIEAGLKAVRNAPPGAVILDLGFPDVEAGGLEFLKVINDLEDKPPVVVLTGQNDFANRLSASRLGAIGFVQKPASPSVVLDLITHAIDRRMSPPLHALAVDDEQENLMLIREILERDGFRVTTQDSPLDFWASLEEAQPDVILLDYDMPRISGLDICRTVRSDPRWSSTPLLLLTGRSDTHTITEAFNAGADDFITKPIVGPEILARIRTRTRRVQGLKWAANLDPFTVRSTGGLQPNWLKS